MPVNHNQRTIKLLKTIGYSQALVVERYCSFSRRKHDLFGIFDVLAIKENCTCGVQITSRSNMSARVKKIKGSEYYSDILKAGWEILVIGWDKPTHRYRHKIINLNEE